MEESGRHYVGQRRVQTGSVAWRRVEGIMWDRGECKQEQQRGGEWKALCGTEESANRSSSVEESGRHYVGQRRVQTGAAAWRRVEGIMWDRGECKQEQQRGGEWKALCGTEESANRSSSVEESGRHYVGQRRVQTGAAAWRRVEGIMWDRGQCKQEQQRGREWKALCGTDESANRSSSVEESGRHYVGQRRVQTGAAAWRRVEGIMWDRGECKQEQQRGGEWKALCGTEESANRSSSVEESGRHYVGQRRVQTGAAAWRRVEGIMWDRGECKQEQQRGGEWKALCGTEDSANRSSSVDESGRHYVGQRRVQTGAAAWRRVEGIMWDRKLKKQLKGKVLGTCVVPTCIYGLGTLALTERQEEKIQIVENNWVRRICKVTQEDRRKMKELREEIGMKKHLKMRVVGSRMRWAGHVTKDQSCDGETVSSEILKGEVRTTKCERPSQKTEGDGES